LGHSRAPCFDAPSANLGWKLRVQLRNEIAQACKQPSASKRYVAQDPVEAMASGDRIGRSKASK